MLQALVKYRHCENAHACMHTCSRSRHRLHMHGDVTVYTANHIIGSYDYEFTTSMGAQSKN